MTIQMIDLEASNGPRRFGALDQDMPWDSVPENERGLSQEEGSIDQGQCARCQGVLEEPMLLEREK